jgi:GWxTD domain-containing protein
MKKIKYLFLVFLFLACIPPLKSADKFIMDSDLSVFKYTEGKSVVELYFAYTQRSLIYVISGNEFLASVNTQVIIKELNSSKELLNQVYGMNSQVSDTSRPKLLSKLIGQQNFTLSPGTYKIILIGSDKNNPSSSDTANFDIVIPQFEPEKTDLSSLQLSTHIEKSGDKNSIFYKNGLEVTPNPNLLFGGNLKKIFYYLEIYNIEKEYDSDSVFFITQIIDMSGNIVESLQKRETVRKAAFVETGFYPADSLQTGSYLFRAMLVNVVTGSKIVREKKYFIFNTALTKDTGPVDNLGYMQSDFITKSEEFIDDEFGKVIYIRTTKETDEYKKLTNVDDKRKFMYLFWKRRDTEPLTAKFEFREEYLKRVSEANKKFKQSFTEGWKTDKGRIFIKYGPPNDIERHFMEANVKNYEIWTYEYVEGGTEAVFAETSTSGEGIYYLVHSTLRNEYQDPNWFVKLKK